MVYGIISEFNPFHAGHQYLIESIKKEGDAVICAMSGNFVQRGEPAVYDKWQRTAAALRGGADIVIEIPSACATLSAPGFAAAGVRLLEATGICDKLAFGAECGDLSLLQKLKDEIQEKDALIKTELAKGFSFPKARQNVIASPLLSQPNNILALEYLKHTRLPCVAVKRIGKGHDSDDAQYSAGEIRRHLASEDIASLNHAERAVLYRLRTMSVRDFMALDDVTEGLENRLHAAARQATGLEEFYSLVKTKRYTHARIRRIVLRAFLGMDQTTPKDPAYLRILGFNATGREYLGAMKKTASLPLVTKYSDAVSIGGQVLRDFKAECRYTDLYHLMFKTPRPCGMEQISQMLIPND